ncbi:thioredoxin [Candidatus Daviesbacteria bacterium]|nr:thioredoxin [Candidatus Daviesbacteria bacterium]
MIFACMMKLLDFWAPWCGPCQMMAPIIEELEKELVGKAEIIKINVDEKPEEAAKYGVMSIPTYIVMKDDKEVGRKIGFTPKAEILKLLQ